MEVVAVLLPVDDDEQELLSRSDRVRVNGIVALTVLESAGETSLPPLRTRANCALLKHLSESPSPFCDIVGASVCCCSSAVSSVSALTLSLILSFSLTHTHSLTQTISLTESLIHSFTLSLIHSLTFIFTFTTLC